MVNAWAYRYPPSMTKRALALVLVAALTACASGGTEGTPVTAPTTTEESASSEPSAAPTLSTTFVEESRAPEGAIEILMLPLAKFEPNVASVEAGTVAFYLKNVQADVRPLLHNFLLGTAIDAPPLAVSPTLASETSGTFTVHGLEPGIYTYWCTVPSPGDGTPHYALGMVGTLTVTE